MIDFKFSRGKRLLGSLYLLFSMLMTGNVIAQNLMITDLGGKGDEITNTTEARPYAR
jgi:hypothetical protein